MFKPLLLLSVFALSLPVFAGDEAGPLTDSTIAGIDWHKVEKILAKHFSAADIESLKAYMKGAMMGVPTPMAPELKAKVRDFMTEMRLEYGFQFAVLMAELKKKVFRVLPPDIAELAEEFTAKLKAELDE